MKVVPTKICNGCKKPFEKPTYRSKTSWERTRFCSRECRKLPTMEFNLSPSAKRQKNSTLKHKFGIDINDYNKIYKMQGGQCKICSMHQSKLHYALAVDHDHNTNKIRGLLCTTCNRALGLFKDNQLLLEKARLYLQQSGSN